MYIYYIYTLIYICIYIYCFYWLNHVIVDTRKPGCSFREFSDFLHREHGEALCCP